MKNCIKLLIFGLFLFPLISSAYFDSSLKYGSRGPDVEELQDFLNDQGFLTGKIDGRFGLGTRKAVMAFQKAQGLAPDGYFGLASRTKASSLLQTDLAISDAAEQTETGTIVSPINKPSPDVQALLDHIAALNGQTQNQQNISIVNTTPKDIDYRSFGISMYTNISRYQYDMIWYNGAEIIFDHLLNGDKITLTLNGKEYASGPGIYGSWGFMIGKQAEVYAIIPGHVLDILSSNTEYPFTAKIERGTQYAIVTGIFKTLADN